MANDYATVAEAKAEAEITDTDHDTVLGRLLDGAARMIDRYCRRPDGFVADGTASARYYPGSGTAIQWIDECAAVSGVAVKDSASDDEDDYTSWTLGTIGSTTEADVFPATGDPRRPDYNRTPYTFLVIGPNGDYNYFTGGRYVGPRGFRPEPASRRDVSTVEITAKWGYATEVPPDIKEATIMQAIRWYKRLQTGMSDAVGSPDLGQILYRQRLDPDVALILSMGGYRRQTVG